MKWITANFQAYIYTPFLQGLVCICQHNSRMALSTFRFFVWLLAFAIPLVSLATHQVGGHIEMKEVGDVPGHYKVTVINYIEDGTRGAATQSTFGSLGIFRKRDNGQMTTFTVQQTGTRDPIIYANAFCSTQRNLKFIVIIYQADIQLNPGTYSDPSGYYISYQTRNRNSGINNINMPDQTGFTFYLEFPAIQQNGQLFSNSSPVFGPINGEYVCAGEPFTFPFGGKDPDGDDLRYSLITPLNQKGTNQNSVSPGPYPDVSWLTGFSAANAIPGSPTLRVDAKTGELSVTASQLGLFVFAVRVEEYRNGIKIGEVRRDFQFLVVDCPAQTTPEPNVQIAKQPKLRNTTICKGDSALLEAAADTSWNYQWRKDGINLAGATKSSLSVRESGEYTVVVSPKAACTKVGNSESLTITVIGNDARLAANGHLCATTGAVTLTAKGNLDVNYQWFRDGQSITANSPIDSLRTSQPGQYWAVLTHTTLGCQATTDKTTLKRSDVVQAVVKSSSGFNRVCPHDSLRLDATGGIRYAWQKDGQAAGDSSAQLFAKQPGTYSLVATDIFGCTGASAPVALVQLPPVPITFDSIPGVCGTNVPAYTLRAVPPGGEFSGPGTSGSAFSAEQAGIGNHTVSYGVRAAPECAATVVKRVAVVAPIPTIELPNSMTTYKGNSFTLSPVYTGNPDQFQWTSATFLDNPGAASPVVMTIENDITYTLLVRNSTGCEAKDTIQITVYAHVWTPEAFSPNGDGLNDVWELPGIEAFPDAVVTIFNRWGELIFSSEKGYPNPFDGTLNGKSLPAGLYAYTLSTVPQKPVIRGSLMLVR